MYGFGIKYYSFIILIYGLFTVNNGILPMENLYIGGDAHETHRDTQ